MPAGFVIYRPLMALRATISTLKFNLCTPLFFTPLKQICRRSKNSQNKVEMRQKVILKKN